VDWYTDIIAARSPSASIAFLSGAMAPSLLFAFTLYRVRDPHTPPTEIHSERTFENYLERQQSQNIANSSSTIQI
jgi:hypothetical protein